MVVKRCQDKRIIYMCVFDIYIYMHIIVKYAIVYHITLSYFQRLSIYKSDPSDTVVTTSLA